MTAWIAFAFAVALAFLVGLLGSAPSLRRRFLRWLNPRGD